MRSAVRTILLTDPMTRWARDAVHAWDFTQNRARFNKARVGPVTNTPNWTFTRASAAYAQTASGALQLFASGVPRITDRGLLIEGSRQNLLTYSQDFSNAAWTNLLATVASGQTTAPDGTTTGWKLTSQGAGARVTQSVVATATTHTYYAILKYGNTTTQTLLLRNTTTATNLLSTNFNLSAGTKADVTGAGGSITALGAGWYLCALTATTGITIGDSLLLYIYTGSPSSSSGDYSFVWHAQCENGAFPSSPITTTSAAVTRAGDADSALSTGLSFPMWGVVRFVRVVDTAGVETLVQIDDGTANNYVRLAVDASDRAELLVVSGGVTQAQVAVTGALSLNTVYTIAWSVGSNTANLTVNGTLGTEDTTVTVPGAPTTIRFGAGISIASPSFGYDQRVAFGLGTKSASELQDLSRLA